MASYENIDWFRNYLTKIESDIQRLENRIETRMEANACRDRMDSMIAFINEKFAANEVAVQLARKDLNKRLESMNDFRSALSDQSSKMLTRDEYIVNHEMFRKELNELTKAKERMEGKASQTSFYIATAIAVFSLFLGAIHILRDFAGMAK